MDGCEVDRFRASGPGGQKRNKTDSAVRLRHVETGVVAQATESRSQHENREIALRRLREALAIEVREPIGESYQVSQELARALASGPRPGGGKARHETVYLLALGELLDVFEASEAVVADCARRLSVSSAAMTRLLCGDVRAHRKANMMRKQRGLKSLRP
jgi:hypothetical protein